MRGIREFFTRPLGAAIIAGWAVLGFFAALRAQDAPPKPAAPPAKTPDTQPAAWQRWLDRLGGEPFTVREEATRQLIGLGPGIAEPLRARLEREADPEVRHRILYILDHIVPPDRAVLVVRAEPDSGLRPGDLITHVNTRRIRETRELLHLLNEGGLMVRVLSANGPREVGPLTADAAFNFSDYRLPQGEIIAQAVRLYSDGCVEQAYELVKELGDAVAETELSPLLRARLAYTAGDAATAQRLMANKADAVQVRDWVTPSPLDLAGPGKAPFHLEWLLWEETTGGRDSDPDLRVQRVLIPARRYVDSLEAAVGFWWTDYRPNPGRRGDNRSRVSGNMLAVASWMLSEMDLASECLRLIEPRSEILGYKWIRVRTDAWLAFLRGNAKEALDGLYDDARDVLSFPQGMSPVDSRTFTRVPTVAATAAFFLYQAPADSRAEELFNSVNRPGHVALAAYAQWMLFSLQEENAALIRKHLGQLLPNAPGADAFIHARAAALLEYVQNVPDDEVLQAARRRLMQAPDTPERAVWLALADALRHLAAGRPEAARAALQPFAARRETLVLRDTLDFLTNPPPGADQHPALQNPLLAVPLGSVDEAWIVLARDRRLLRFDVKRNVVAPLEKPSPSWYPGPVNWPWLGREETTGRVWVYDRRRVLEIGRAGATAVRLNIQARDIPVFDRVAGPVFSVVAEAARAGEAAAPATAPVANSEAGEFWREDLRAHGEFVGDPDLPEIGWVRVLPEAPQFAQLALRGGESFLIDTAANRVWSSAWLTDKLGLPAGAPLKSFFAQAVLAAAPDGPPVVFLMSDRGLLRFDPAGEAVTRIALPGQEPHPPVIPESTPYARHDPRWVYCAKPPEAGGHVFRVNVADNRAEVVNMINMALPEGYYESQSRAALRADLDRRLRPSGVPSLRQFVEDAAQTVAKWKKEQQR